MKRPTDSKAAGGSLPTFLDDDALGAQAAPGADTDADALDACDVDREDADDHAEPADEGPEGSTMDADDPRLGDAEEPADLPIDPGERPRARHAPRGRKSSADEGSVGTTGGAPTIVLGVLLAAFGAAAAALPGLGTALATLGATPGLAIATGLVLLFVGGIARRQQRLQHELVRGQQQATATQDRLLADLEALLLARDAGAAALDGGELQHLLLATQRQDQKINNLTKAIKMYGKPLMEIASQGTETAGIVGQVRTLVEGSADASRQSVVRLERALQAVELTLKKGAQQPAEVDLGDLPQQVKRLEIALAAITQRLDNPEVQKSLLRLEDASSRTQAELQELRRGEVLQRATAELQTRLEQSTRGLQDGLAQLRDGNLGGLENVVREIQREVAGVATSVAQIQVAVRNGARAAAPPPAGATPSHAAAPQPGQPPVPHAAAAAPEAPVSARGERPADDTSPEGSSGYQTGKRSSAGKNVLGAIAKLKQMKS